MFIVDSIYIVIFLNFIIIYSFSLRTGRPRFDPGCRRGEDFSSLLRVRTAVEVHSAFYKMSTGAFPGGKGGRA